MIDFVGISLPENHIIGCHGNHAFSHSKNNFIFDDNFIRMYGVPMSNLATMRYCPGCGGSR